jgi:hypothetical protein
LDAIGNKEISMRDLRIKLNTLQHEQPVGDSNRRSTFIKKSADFEKDVLSTLQSSLAEFQCPANSEFSAMPKRKSRMAFEISIATPNALAFEHESIATSSTGFKIYYADNESIRKNIPNLIYQCCYMSTFLSRLILILPDTIDPDMGQKIADVFSRTKHLNVGVALLKQGASKAGTDGNFIFLSRPFPKMEPTPDCRQIVNWNSILVRADLGSDGIPTDIEKE